MYKWDIYYADLSPVKGSEQGGVRPVLIIQNDVGNKHAPTTIIAPITSKVFVKHNLPTHIGLNGECGLAKESMVLLEQIRVIDKSRLKKRIGKVTNSFDCFNVEQGIKISLGLK